MALRLYNTLSGKVEEFQPINNNEVRMYACGPTVYDYGHIGNFRTFVAVDVLRRFLCQSGYTVRHVMNITDLDDKIIHNAAQAGLSVQQYTAKYEKAFLEDAATLNIEQPILVRATEHIPEMAQFVADLEKKGFAYRAEDGSYYFRIAKFPGYGKLSKKDFAGMEDGARVDVDEYEKDNARDFALWKAPKKGEASWESPIGRGRPGWHIECSVMSMLELGESFDGLKQAASNVEKLRNFHLRLTTGQFSPGSNPEMQELANEAGERMKSALEDDLNTAQAQAAIFEMVRKANVAIDAGQIKQGDARSLLAALGKFDEIFAVLKDDDAPKMQSILQWAKEQGREKEISAELIEVVGAQSISDKEVQKKIAEIEAARAARDFKRSDAIRAELNDAGIMVEITKDGVRWRRK